MIKNITVLFIMVFLLVGCSPVYHFYFDPMDNNKYSFERTINRLSDILTPEQFIQLHNTPAIGPARLSECKQVNMITTFEEYAVDVVNDWVWVHIFLCDKKVRIVVVSGMYAEDEAKRIYKLLRKEFANELRSGILKIEKRYRLSLE